MAGSSAQIHFETVTETINPYLRHATFGSASEKLTGQLCELGHAVHR